MVERAEPEGGPMLAALLLAVVLLVVLAWVTAAVVVWRLWRLLRRRLRASPSLRAVQAWTAPPGPRRQVAGLRRELAEAGQLTSRALAVVRAAGGPVGELPHLARRLERLAGTLDAELRLLAAEPDPAELARVLPAAEARVADVTRVAHRIRRAAGAGLGAGTAAELAPLAAEVEREVAALDAGVDRLLGLASGA
jgi:hypothetical protein